MKSIPLLGLVGLVLTLCNSANASSKYPQRFDVEASNEAFDYLKTLGYGDASNSSNSADAELVLRGFQTSYNLTVTQKFDPQTLELLNTYRCSMKDKLVSPHRRSQQGSKSKKRFTWKLSVLGLAGPDEVEVRQRIRQSFDYWATLSMLNFDEVSKRDEADVRLTFVSERHKQHDRDYRTGSVSIDQFSGIIRFETAKEWWTDKYNSADHKLYVLVAHYIGHVLGLEHSNDRSSMMYPYHSLVQPSDVLSESDRASIRTLYEKCGTTVSDEEQLRSPRAIRKAAEATVVRPLGELVKSRMVDGRYINSFNSEWKVPSLTAVLRWKIGSRSNTGLPNDQKELERLLPVTHHRKSEELYRTRPGLRCIWIGHASCYVQMNNFRFLVDPIFSDRCGMHSVIGPKRFRPPALTVNDLPDNLDAVFISHNHFDHLDYLSVKNLNKRFGEQLTWFCGRGHRQWFADMRVKNVIELDWWEEHHFSKKDVHVAFCPAQHWSRRGMFDINKSLWGGFAIWDKTHKFYYAGDSGYTHNISIFRQIGQKYGPFDLSAIPIGAYEPKWIMETQHVDPAEAVQIHLDVQSNRSIGVHWGTWALTGEYFMEPATKLAEAVKHRQLDSRSFTAVKHGEIVDVL